MGKNKKAELKSKDDAKGVAENSKKIGNKAKKNADKLKKTLETSGNAVAASTIATNGAGLKNAKKDKQKKKKQQQKLEHSVAPAASNDDNVASSVTANGQDQKKGAKKDKHKKKQSAGGVELLKADSTTNDNQKELTAKQLAKIEKKKAKKLAQKLRKKQMKLEATKTVDKVKTEKPAKSGAKENSKDKHKPADKIKKHKADKKNKIKDEGEKKEYKPRDPALEAATLFVGNLPVNTKRVQVLRHFEAYGPVNTVRFRTASGKVIFKHKHRLEAGTLNAYVVLKSAETAEQALALNGSVFKGNHLRVTKADEKAQSANDADAKRTVFVGNLKYTATEDKLHDIFSSCGEIDYVRCLRDGEKGCKGVAYVCFKAPDAVGLAMELNETMLDERPIHVERYTLKKLGAKQSRDEAAAVEKKSQTGVKKRIDQKKKKMGNGEAAPKSPTTAAGEKAKKSKFHGVKVNAMKNKQNKKKKIPGQMQALAKKIAPKKESR